MASQSICFSSVFFPTTLSVRNTARIQQCFENVSLLHTSRQIGHVGAKNDPFCGPQFVVIATKRNSSPWHYQGLTRHFPIFMTSRGQEMNPNTIKIPNHPSDLLPRLCECSQPCLAAKALSCLTRVVIKQQYVGYTSPRNFRVSTAR